MTEDMSTLTTINFHIYVCIYIYTLYTVNHKKTGIVLRNMKREEEKVSENAYRGVFIVENGWYNKGGIIYANVYEGRERKRRRVEVDV